MKTTYFDLEKLVFHINANLLDRGEKLHLFAGKKEKPDKTPFSYWINETLIIKKQNFLLTFDSYEDSLNSMFGFCKNYERVKVGEMNLETGVYNSQSDLFANPYERLELNFERAISLKNGFIEPSKILLEMSHAEGLKRQDKKIMFLDLVGLRADYSKVIKNNWILEDFYKERE